MAPVQASSSGASSSSLTLKDFNQQVQKASAPRNRAICDGKEICPVPTLALDFRRFQNDEITNKDHYANHYDDEME